MYVEYYNTIGEVSTDVSHKEDDFMDTFAPIPPDNDDEVLELFLNFIGLGTTIGTAGIFNSGTSGPVRSRGRESISLTEAQTITQSSKRFLSLKRPPTPSNLTTTRTCHSHSAALVPRLPSNSAWAKRGTLSPSRRNSPLVSTMIQD